MENLIEELEMEKIHYDNLEQVGFNCAVDIVKSYAEQLTEEQEEE